MKQLGVNYAFDESSTPIGQGAFSKVYLGKTHEGTPVAVKVVELANMEGKTKAVAREIDIMKQLHHENIVELHYMHYEQVGRTGLKLYIVMEHCANGDMSTLPKIVDEERCRLYFQQLAHGLRYLHNQGIVHRDLKPQNVLLTAANKVKIADFTFARHVEQAQMLQTLCGTPIYTAPEILNGKQYNHKCDLWSIGVMLYSFLYGSHPLGTLKTHADLMTKMNNAKITYPQKLVMETYERDAQNKPILCRTVHHFSDECVLLLRRLLEREPNLRPSWDVLGSDLWLALDGVVVPAVHTVVHAHSAPSRVSEFPQPLPPRYVKAKTVSSLRVAPPRVDQPSLASSSSSDLGFAMSLSSGREAIPHTEVGKGSVIIEDYAKPNGTTPVFISRPRPTSLLSRSIETIQSIF